MTSQIQPDGKEGQHWEILQTMSSELLHSGNTTEIFGHFKLPDQVRYNSVKY